MHTNLNDVMCFFVSDMPLTVHSNTIYISARRVRSRAGSFFLGRMPQNNKPIQVNGSIALTCAVLKILTVSVAEEELDVLSVDPDEARVIRRVLAELGNQKPPMSIHINNTTSIGIIESRIKTQQSRSTEM